MDKNIRIAQYTDQRMVSPVEENFMTIDGATYATGKDGQGLYRLIPEEQARFFNEAVPINGKFRLKKCLTDEKKKEAHWKRDKNLRDVLMHLHEWHLLLLAWLQNRENGCNKPFLMEGYNWKTYGDMNLVFYNRCQTISEEEALEKFKDSHKRVMEALDTFSQEELFTNTFYPWVGGSCIGGYFISTTSSHYDWAMKKI